MRKGRRSKERLFYWPSRALLGLIFAAMAMPAVWAQGPALTTISDTVYRADGTVATGTALISWPAFQTAEGNAVAAGTKTATIGAAGAFSTQLVPNVGAAPTGTYYTVVFQLDDGTVRREYWSVPTTSPATIAAVRTTPGTGAANGLVSKQYVDAAVASRAADAVVVHLAGAEVIQGAKQFAAPPAVPTPTTANKNLKGVLNVGGNSATTGPTHLITLFDFEPDKSAAYGSSRAPNSIHDTFIGIDSSNTNTTVGLSVGSYGSISQYIANNGDGTNWLERLTATLKEFKTAAKFDGTVTIAGLAAGCLNISSTGLVGSTGVACGAGGGGAVSSVFGRTGAVVAVNGDYSVSQVTGAAADSAVVHNTGTETIAGAKTFSNDVSLSGNLNIAGNIVQTGSGAWNVEGAYGTMTAAAAGKSKIGFTSNGKLAVSENAGAVTEVAKNYPQQFTYTFFDPNNLLTTALQVPSIYVNRAAAFHIVEVYCEIDAGSMTINLQNAGANLLSTDLACSTSGATSSSFVSGKDAVASGVKIGHATVSASGSVHRVNVVVKYTVD